MKVAVILVTLATTAFAQQHTIPMPPQSGYDPFVYNRYSGRFDYVPIPYEAEPVGSSYSPFRFNWHSGRWDYVAFPLPSDYDNAARQEAASTYVDTRLDTRVLTPRTIAEAEPAPPITTTFAPPPINPHVSQQATKPTTKPSKHPPIADQRLARLRTMGRWDFDYARGKWIFVLPSDQ